MNALAERFAPRRFAPSVTRLIRADHTKVIAGFHRYDLAASPARKAALVGKVCLSLEVHAQAEEEIFYPAVRAAHPALVEQSVPEHNEMRALIQTLRAMDATQEGYDRVFMELMRVVLHHVADEETTLLPTAERFVGEALGELGLRFMKRKLELMAPRAGEMAKSSLRAPPPVALAVAAGALLAGAWLMRRRAS